MQALFGELFCSTSYVYYMYMVCTFMCIFDIFSIGSCAAILNRDLFDLFDFLLKKECTNHVFLSKMSFLMILRATGATEATGATGRDLARNPGIQIQSLDCK